MMTNQHDDIFGNCIVCGTFANLIALDEQCGDCDIAEKEGRLHERINLNRIIPENV